MRKLCRLRLRQSCWCSRLQADCAAFGPGGSMHVNPFWPCTMGWWWMVCLSSQGTMGLAYWHQRNCLPQKRPGTRGLRALGPWGTVCSYGGALAAHVARFVALPRLHSLHSLHSRQMAGQGLQRGPSHVPDLVVGGRSRGGPDGTELNRLMGECCRMLQMGTSPFPNSRPKMCCMMSNSIISQQSV